MTRASLTCKTQYTLHVGPLCVPAGGPRTLWANGPNVFFTCEEGMEEGRGANQRHEMASARCRGKQQLANIAFLANGPCMFTTLKHGGTRLGAGGAETTITYAKKMPLQKRGKRKDDSQILALGGILGASLGPLGGMAARRPLGGLLGPSRGPLGTLQKLL